jgi:hypothetical protein
MAIAVKFLTYSAITSAYYRGAVGALLVYDVICRQHCGNAGGKQVRSAPSGGSPNR